MGRMKLRKPLKPTRDGLPGKGETTVKMAVQGKHLVLVFTKPVSWLGFERAEAERFIADLQTKLRELPALRVPDDVTQGLEVARAPAVEVSMEELRAMGPKEPTP